jgi:hypothetical protein
LDILAGGQQDPVIRLYVSVVVSQENRPELDLIRRVLLFSNCSWAIVIVGSDPEAP